MARVRLSFDVVSNPGTAPVDHEALKTEMWDYVAKLIKGFNVDHIGVNLPLTARFPTAEVEVC